MTRAAAPAMMTAFPMNGELQWMRCRATRRQVHQHHAWECIRAIEDGVAVTCVDQPFPLAAGEVVILPPRLPHAVHTLGVREAQVDILCCSERLIDGLRTADIGIERLEQAASLGLRFSPGTVDWPARPPEGAAETLIALIRCLASAARCPASRPLMQSDGLRPSLVGAQHHASILAYIEEHHQNPISLSHCASALGISQATICRTLRHHAGTSFAELLSARRLQTAERLMTVDRLPLGEVAYQAGFGSVASFNRQFRCHHRCSPTAWLAARSG